MGFPPFLLLEGNAESWDRRIPRFFFCIGRAEIPVHQNQSVPRTGRRLVTETGERKVIAFALSGHGNFDLAAYEAHLTGRLEDQDFNDAETEQALISLLRSALLEI